MNSDRISFLKWRKTLLDKYKSETSRPRNGTNPAGRARIFRLKSPKQPSRFCGGDLRMIPLLQYYSPLEAETLVRRLSLRFRKLHCFRNEKIERLRRRIKAGQYRIPAMDVVDRWLG